jgi:hypothetical protein
LEAGKLTALYIPSTVTALLSYMNRQGRTDWPNIGKFPYNGDALDTCKEKGVVPVPYATVAITPYLFGSRDVTLPAKELPIGLCVPYSIFQYFCPSHQNAALKPIVEWVFDPLHPYGVFDDGTTWEPMGLVECLVKCPRSPNGTAYIGDGPHGIVV